MNSNEKANNVSRRDEFLLRLYDNLWRSIERIESGTWQSLALYAIVAGLMIGEARQFISQSEAAIFGMIVSFWGMNVAINAEKWYSRNLLFVVNIEKQFLDKDDFGPDAGRILPPSYHERKPQHNTLNIIHFIAFLAVTVWSIYVVWPNFTGLPIGILVVGTILTVYHYIAARKVVQDFIKGTNPEK